MWPNLVSLENGSRPGTVSPAHWDRLRDIARLVRARTHCLAWLDVWGRELCFGYPRSDGYVPGFSCAFKIDRKGKGPNWFDPAVDNVGVEELVYLIQLGKVSPRKKAQWMAQHQRRAEQERQAGLRAWMDERRKDAMERIDRAYERMSMGRHYRGRGVVSGLRVPARVPA